MLRTSRKQELKESIYLKAMQLYMAKGFDNVTVDEITAACGIAKGTFYNYFAKKEAVLLHLGHSQMEVLRQSLTAHSGVPLIKDKIAALFCDLAERYSTHPELLRITLAEIVRSPEILGEEMTVMHSFKEALVPLLEEAKRLGQMSQKCQTELAARVLAGLYFQVLVSYAGGEIQGAELKSSLIDQVELVWHGMRSNSKGG